MELVNLTLNTQNLLGSTTNNIKQLAQTHEHLIYVSGSYIAFYNPITAQQTAYIKHRSSNINCLSVSSDQHLLAVTDRAKHPLITIYNICNLQVLRGNQNTPLRQLKAHKHSIDLLCFSPNNKYLVSISNHDNSMFLWQGTQTITRNRLSKTLTKVFFDSNSNLISLGSGYFKVWSFKNGEVLRRLEDNCWIMEGRLINFNRKFTSKQFVDGKSSKIQAEYKLILLSSDGFICIIKSNYESIQKWIDLTMPVATGIELLGNTALCSGDSATIKAIDLSTLTLKIKFPKTHPINQQNLSQKQMLQNTQKAQFPKCLGMKCFQKLVATLYQNKTIFIWQFQADGKPISSIISHQERVNSICLLEQISKDLIFFGTASQDHTIRIWHFYKKQYTANKELIDIASEIGLKRNPFCRHLTRIIYTHSEHPITHIKMYQSNTIACISRQQCLLYSLDDYELLIHQTFLQENILIQFLSLQTDKEYIYIGKQNGIISVYKPDHQRLLKIRDIIMQMPVQTLQIANSRLMAQGKGRLKCISLDNKVLANQYNLQCGIMSHSFLILCQKTSISLYNWTKSKKTASLTLSHQLDQRQQIRLVRSNSWLIVLVTNTNRLIVANFSSTVLYNEELTDLITDCAVTQGGEILLTTDGGTIIIKTQEDNSQYHRIDEKVKKWFERNNLSWMQGSVWVSTQFKSQLVSTNKQKLPEIQQAQSIRLSPDKTTLVKPQLSGGVVEYRNSDNKQSIFDPNQIYEQANKIYKDVGQLMKHQKQKTKSNDKKDDLQLSGSLQQLKLSSMSISKNSNIKHERPSYSKFTNNLVESVISPLNQLKTGPNQADKDENTVRVSSEEEVEFEISKQESKPLLQSQSKTPVLQTNSKQSTPQLAYSIKELLQNYSTLKDNRQQLKQVIDQHLDDYLKLYQLLSIGLDRAQIQKQKRKALAQKYKIFSKQFLQQLQQ